MKQEEHRKEDMGNEQEERRKEEKEQKKGTTKHQKQRGEMSVWRCERKWETRAKEWRTLQKARRWAHNGGGKDRGKEKKNEREPHWRKRGGRSKKTNIREKTRKGKKNTLSCCPCLNCVPGYEQVLVIVLSLWSQWRFPCLVREMWFHICIAALYSPCVGLYSLRRRRLISIGILIINLRRSSDRLRFIMGIPIPVRRRLLSE